MSLLRVIVVDDNPVLLRSVERFLNATRGVEVVGGANSGRAGLELVDRLRPDAVLIDLTMPGMDGLEATRRLSTRPESPVVIMMTIHDLPEYRDAARAAGAHAFVTKSGLAESLQPILRRLQLGRGLVESGQG